MSIRRFIVLGLVTSILLALGCGTSGDPDDSTIIIPKDGSGVIRVRLQFAVGSSYDPAGREGLAYFTANAIRRGTSHFSRTEIDDQLDALAAQLTIEVDRDVTIIEGLCLTESWSEFSRLFVSAVTEPRFDSTEMSRLVDDQIDDIEQIRRNDVSLAKAALQYYVYRDHPYGHPVEGLEHTVKQFTPDHARSFYQSNFTTGNYLLGLSGEVGNTIAEELHTALQQGLPPGKPEPPMLPQPALSGLHVYLIEKENRTQTQVRIGCPIDIGRDDPDFMPWFLANTYLGRHRESIGRLYQIIRTKRGLSYGAYSYAEHFDQDQGSNLARPGRPRRQQYFSTWVYPKTVNANFVIKVVLKELNDLATEGISDSLLDLASTFEINHFPFEIETPRRLLGMRMDERYLGTPTFVDSFAVVAGRVTHRDVRRVVSSAIDAKNMVIIAVVSDAEEFAKHMIDGPILVEYPSGVSPKTMRFEDPPYMRYLPFWNPQTIRIVQAEEMFR